MANEIATITGIIGAATGIAGFVMGFIAYKHSKQITISNRRLELEKLQNIVIHHGEVLLNNIQLSASKVLAEMGASGVSESSYNTSYQEQATNDKQTVLNIMTSVPSSENNHKSKSRIELEDIIVDLDRKLATLKTLQEKYNVT